MRMPFAILVAATFILIGTSAGAAPATTASLRLEIQGLAAVTVTGIGTISVQPSSTTFVPAGLLQVISPITVPVTSTTTVAQLRVTKLSNLSGTFRTGGALSQAPGETCPPAPRQACVTGGGRGGVMALTGTINVTVLIHPIPLVLNAARIGQGGSTNVPFTYDAAPWTTGVGRVNTGAGTLSTTGTNAFASGGPLTLVTPTYLDALGTLLPILATFSLGQGSHVPEPGTLWMLAAGAAGLALTLRKRG